MRSGRGDFSVVKDQDQVRVLYRRHALGDDDLRGLGDEAAESRPDQGIGMRIHRAGGIVQDQDLRLLQQGPRDAEPLPLASGDIGPALLDVGIVLLREALDKLFRLGKPAGLSDFLVCCVRIAPAQVFQDGSREEHVLLQHHGHRVAQALQVVLPHVPAADADTALRHIVEPRDQLDQGGFSGTGSAQNAHRRP